MPKGTLGTPATIDIGPIKLGGSPATPDTYTIGDVSAEIEADGGQLARIIRAKDGVATIDPGYVLQPGDKVEALNKDRGTYLATVGTDGLSLSDWTMKSGPPSGAKQAGAGDYPDPNTVTDPLEFAKQTYTAIRNDPKATPTDIANAATAYRTEQDKAAGKKPTQGQPELHNFGTPTHPNWHMGVKDITTGDWKPAGGSSSPVAAAIDQVTSDPRVQMAMKMGASLEGGLGSTFNAGDGGMSWGPFQINHNNGMHADISRAAAEDPLKAAQYMLSEYAAAVDKVSPVLWQTNPKQAAAQAAYFAERPAEMYPQSRVDAGWNTIAGGGDAGLGFGGVPPNKQLKTIGSHNYTFDPQTGSLTDTGIGSPIKPDTVERNGKTYQFDPTTDTWQLASGLPDDELAAANLQKARQELLPKAQLALSQQYDTLQYIHQQVAAGRMSPADASAYYGSVKQQTSAALAGTTPFAIYKQAQDFQNQQATNAKALLDTQVTASGALVDNLLKGLAPDAKVPPLVRSSVPFDINGVMDAAQSNIQRYIPQGLTTSAQNLLSSFYGPQAPAPGQTDAAGMPLHPADIANLPLASEPAGPADAAGVQDFAGGPIGGTPTVPDQQAA